MNKETDTQKHIDEGYRAYYKGDDLEDCPHQVDSEAYFDWIEGWYIADESNEH